MPPLRCFGENGGDADFHAALLHGASRDTIATPNKKAAGVGMSETRPLHRLFGLSWIDFFQGTPVAVETELDLSLKQQFIDLVLIRKGPGPIPARCPTASRTWRRTTW